MKVVQKLHTGNYEQENADKLTQPSHLRPKLLINWVGSIWKKVNRYRFLPWRKGTRQMETLPVCGLTHKPVIEETRRLDSAAWKSLENNRKWSIQSHQVFDTNACSRCTTDVAWFALKNRPFLLLSKLILWEEMELEPFRLNLVCGVMPDLVICHCVC